MPKRNGGVRQIQAPTKALLSIQKAVHEAISIIVKPSAIAHGYVRGKTIVDNAKPHRARRWVVAIDLADYFPSINFGRVRGAFLSAPFRFPPEVATCLAQICCLDDRLPQGAPTSPVISNLISAQLDSRLLKIAKASRCVVTRYADDICFSTNLKCLPLSIAKLSPNGSFIPGDAVTFAIESSGFKVNVRKFKVMSRRDQQMVTGLVVNKVVSMPRRWRRQLRSMFHVFKEFGEDEASKIFAAWKHPPAKMTKVISSKGLVTGRSGFLHWLDGQVNGNSAAALYRAFPSLRKLMPRRAPAKTLRIYLEGPSDEMHFRAALEYFHGEGDFREIVPRYPTMGDVRSDKELWDVMQRIARVVEGELSVAIFDCDNQQLMKQMSLNPGCYRAIGDLSFIGCLAYPRIGYVGPFCIESLYDREEATQFTEAGRRIFFSDEFNALSGLSESGEYRVDDPRRNALVVSTSVERVSDGFSSLLSKKEFSQMILNKEKPFKNISFSGFRATFEMISRIIADTEGR